MNKKVRTQLWRAKKGSACAGFTSEKRYLVRCAPVLRRYKTSHVTQFIGNLRQAGWRVSEVKDVQDK